MSSSKRCLDRVGFRAMVEEEGITVANLRRLIVAGINDRYDDF